MSQQAIKDAKFNTLNLVGKVSDEELIKIGNAVVEDTRIDISSKSEWETRRANWVKLFMQHTEPKTWPWRNASNVPLPILTTAVIQFQSRAYEALMPPKEKMRVDITGDEDLLRAKRVQKHMNYQLNYQMEEYEAEWDLSLMQLPINGSIFRKIFYDNVQKRNMAIYVSAADVIVPYNTKPNLVPRRITHILRMTENDIKVRQRDKIYHTYEDVEFGPGSITAEADTGQNRIKEESDRTEGIHNPGVESDSLAPRIVFEQHRDWDLDGDGITEPYIITVDKETGKVLRITKRTYISPSGEEIIINHFEHYYFFPNPEGYYGLGFGHMLEGINEAAMSILNQIIDAGTLANLNGKTGFINARSGIKQGAMEMELGKWKNIEVNAEDIRKAIYSFEFDGPSQVLFATLGLLQEYADKVTTVSDILSGELPKSDTPATAIVAAIEQGMKVMSVIHKRVHRVYKGELKKLYTFNGIYGDQKQYEKILGEKVVNAHQEAQIPFSVLEDYNGFMDIMPTSDPNISSRTEQIAVAEQILNQTLSNPAISSNMESQREAYTRFYEALRVPNFEALLPQAPPPPPDLPQEQENAMMMVEQQFEALAPQDHLAHIAIIDELLVIENPFRDEITPRAKRLIEQHRLQHVSFQYLDSTGQLDQQSQQQPGQEPI